MLPTHLNFQTNPFSAYQERISKTIKGPDNEFLNSEPLKQFLQDAVGFLGDHANTAHAEGIAHYLMGKVDYLPQGFETSATEIPRETREKLNDLLRTNRFNVIKEGPNKTREKILLLANVARSYEARVTDDFQGRIDELNKKRASDDTHALKADGLEEFLSSAIEFLKQPGNEEHAEGIAHFLMGIQQEPPEGIKPGNLQLSKQQKSELHDLLRTHRYSFFGTEEGSQKTISKLSVLLNTVREQNVVGSNERRKELAPGGYLLNINYIPTIQATGIAAAPDGSIPSAALSLKNILSTAPLSIKFHPNFPEFVNCAFKFLEYMKPAQGEQFAEILARPGLTLLDLVGSIKAYSELDPATAREKCMERDLVNLQMNRKILEQKKLMEDVDFDFDQNDFGLEVLGVSHSYTDREDAELKPGTQVSLAMDTQMRREDGTLVNIKTLTVSMPAMDNQRQPEFKIYTDGKTTRGDATLKTEEFTAATAAIKKHIIQWVGDNKPCKRVVLSAIGAAEFLGMLNSTSIEDAKEIIASALAEVVTALNAEEIPVGFCDLDDSFCNRIAAKLPDGGKINFLGKLPRDPDKVDNPQDWLQNGDLLLIPGDASSLVGNGGRLDTSFEGYVGRNSTVSLQHALAISAARLGLA